MVVHGKSNFGIQFLSLIKFFSNITMEYSNVTSADKYTVRDPGMMGAETVDLVVPNRQVYRFAREGWLSQKTMPEVVDLNVTTTLTLDKQSGLILRHHDVWEGKAESELYGKVGKPFVGRFTSGLLKLFY